MANANTRKYDTSSAKYINAQPRMNGTTDVASANRLRQRFG